MNYSRPRDTVRPFLFALFGCFLFSLGIADGAHAQTASAGILSTLDPSTQGGAPNAPIIGPDGNLYTTTRSGGASYAGTVLKITPAGVAIVLHTIDSQTEGTYPAPLTFGGDGALYGTTVSYIGGATIFRVTTDGEYTTLFTAPADGEETSYNALVEGDDGNLYGCLNVGGSPSILFAITPSGSMTTLHVFTAAEVYGNCFDSVLARGTDGDVYGMTQPGSASNPPGGTPQPVYNGIFFRVTGGYQLLHAFFGGEADGTATPSSELNPVAAGFVFAGLNSLSYPEAYIYPTLSEIGTDGTVTIVHEYDVNSIYSANSILGGDGNLYFSEATGGTEDSLSLFRESADGSTTTELCMLALPSGDQAGKNPLTAVGDGSFYGTTQVSIFRAVLYAVKPIVTIRAAPMKIEEKNGLRAKVTVERRGDDLASPLKVELKFEGTAVNGKDYKKLAPTVTIPAGSADGVLYVKALNVGRKGGHQTININVTSPTNGSYLLGKPSKATVNIKDNG